MKKIYILGSALLLSQPLCAQNEEAKDTLTTQMMMQNLPEVFVKATRPIVKVERGQLVYNMPLLIEKMPADNAYDALTRIPGVNELNGNINYAGKELTLIINGKPTTLNYAQLAERLKAMPSSQLAKAEVMLAAPARLHVRGMVINLITKDYVEKKTAFRTNTKHLEPKQIRRRERQSQPAVPKRKIRSGCHVFIYRWNIIR